MVKLNHLFVDSKVIDERVAIEVVLCIAIERQRPSLFMLAILAVEHVEGDA